MNVDILGLGPGSADCMTAGVSEAIQNAELIIGAQRLLEALPACSARLVNEYRSDHIADILKESGAGRAAVVLSGDTGFYSGASGLLPLLDQAGISWRICPGVSSVQALAAALGESWQDWRLCSAHGTGCDAVEQVCCGRSTFFLTGGPVSPAELCRELARAGLGELEAVAGENLSYPDQRLRKGTVEQLAEEKFGPLSVLLVRPAPLPPDRAPGIPDDRWIRGDVPMTKQEVRTVILAKLAVQDTDCCWDVGAGTGSVSVEMALHARQCWAVEQNEKALALMEENRKRFMAWKMRIVAGTAPAALDGLPVPDAVFVGGSRGALKEILTAVVSRNPEARVCVSAITPETLSAACVEMESLDLKTEVTQVSVSRSERAGRSHLMKALNPVFLISGERA
ncbi:MAG: precorrin-6y C5,15-methyltransferase (decarboxylating) subunit CbiE [Oscillospiraceae bacterium]|nr:precorrin-6y C5,15-methyltransferase (decarboxylating) subunit CbiE [Oscillospiraceae bacterium]